jgi:endonuclease III
MKRKVTKRGTKPSASGRPTRTGTRRAAKARKRPASGHGRAIAPPAVRAPEIYERLARVYPDAECALDHRNPFELLVATILSAQCTDARVNMVTPALFARYPGPEQLSVANPEELQDMIRSTGFFRNKTRNLLGMSSAVVEKHGGKIPETMDELVKLPGVGRKTANVVLGNAFGRDEGVVVDTHVSRLSNRLALSRQTDPVKIEQDLMALYPRQQWTMLAHLLISHGREICDARRPLCEQCVVNSLCPSSRV